MKAGLTQGWDSYVLAQSVDEALEGLNEWTGGARVIAGGTDLTIEASAKGRERMNMWFDVTRIPGLCGIKARPEGGIAIGAATTRAEVAGSDLVRPAQLLRSC